MQFYAKSLILLFLVFPLITNAGTGYIWKLFNTPTGISIWSIQLIQKTQASEKTLREIIEDYIDLYAPVYKVNPNTIKRVIECESGFSPTAKGDYRNGIPMAYGVAQFWRATFDSFKKEANVEDLEYKNWMHQLDLMFYAFSTGKQNHWTCR